MEPKEQEILRSLIERLRRQPARREISIAITKLEEAVLWLDHLEREQARVEPKPIHEAGPSLEPKKLNA